MATTIKQIKEMLDQYDENLEVTNSDGDSLIRMEESEYDDGDGMTPCVMLEFENDD